MQRLTQGRKLDIILQNGYLSTTRSGEYAYIFADGVVESMECDNPFTFINYILKKHRLM